MGHKGADPPTLARPDPMPLTALQQSFCEQYVILREGKAAYEQAGGAARVAKAEAHKLLQRDDIRAEIDRLTAIRDADFGMTAGDVLREIANVALFDIGTVLEWGEKEIEDGEGMPLTLPNGDPVMQPVIKPVPSDRLTIKERRAIKSVAMSKEGVFKLETHDRMAALQMLGKHLGLFERDNRQKGEGMADAISALVASAQGAPLMPNAMGDDED